MTYKLIDIEGIGPAYAEKFSVLNLHTTDDLFARVSDPTQKQVLCEKVGIGEKQLHSWLCMADLMRIKGIGPQYAEVLMHGGIDSVETLRAQRPDALLQTFTTVNREKNLTNGIPHVTEVTRWVESAAALEPVLVRS